jgi:lipopolysaccharide heptosyltransferase I
MKIALQEDPRKILIIKPSAIGDVVHTLPILNLLRKRFKDARISWLVTPACAGLLDGHPMLDDIILFERKRFAASWRDPAAAKELYAFARDLRDRRFDLVIDLQGLLRSGWLTWQTGAPVRVGFANAREFAWIAYTHRVKIDTMQQHAVERYLSLAEALGCGRAPVEFPFATDAGDRAYLSSLLQSMDEFAVLLPGTNWPTKRWPVEYFARLPAVLRSKWNLATVVAGGPDVAPLAAQIPDSLDLTGKTNLRQLTALLEKSTIVIANDSGPMHIASALGKRLITLFGPTNPVRTGPYQRLDTVVRLEIPCSPCYSRDCTHQSCMRWMTPEMVTKALDQTMCGNSRACGQ